VPPLAIPGTLPIPLAIVSRRSRESVVVQADLGELVEHWMLLDDGWDLVAGKRGPMRLGSALILKFHTRHGRFPAGRSEAVAYVA
jgi:hypothetical protein